MNLAYSLESSSVKELSVSQISAIIKKTFDDNFGFVKVRGEISGLKIATSGHAYFNLKDQEAILACTCWKPILSRVNFRLEEGLEVIISGKITTFAGQSKYQLSAERIELAGAGALMELLNKRKEQLQKEGLFDQSRKKKIPFLPSKIGVITSPVGAVIQDILHRIKDRFPLNVMIWPVAVQGELCAFEVSSAINGFNKMDEEMRPSVIIIARGGGSIEDLWGFNEEIVVRAIANSSIPIISAIGHETDFTLSDFASDLRAPTPTAAAEFAVPIKDELTKKIIDNEKRYKLNLLNYLNSAKSKIDLQIAKLSGFDRILFSRQQKLDELSFKLDSGLPNLINLKKNKLQMIKLPISAISNLIDRKNIDKNNLFEKLKFCLEKFILSNNNKLILQSKLLNSLSINQILNRGFAIVKNESGNVVSSWEDSKQYSKFELCWHDGKSKVTKDEV